MAVGGMAMVDGLDPVDFDGRAAVNYDITRSLDPVLRNNHHMLSAAVDIYRYQPIYL